MHGFRFRLQRVLEWETEQLEAERNRTSQCYAALAITREKAMRLRAEHLAVEQELQRERVLSASDVLPLQGYRAGVRKRERQFAIELQERQRELDSQVARLERQERKVKLIENLKSRHLEEHRVAADQEVERIASDSYLARWGEVRRSLSPNTSS
jgi:hypothetical protein